MSLLPASAISKVLIVTGVVVCFIAAGGTWFIKQQRWAPQPAPTQIVSTDTPIAFVPKVTLLVNATALTDTSIQYTVSLVHPELYKSFAIRFNIPNATVISQNKKPFTLDPQFSKTGWQIAVNTTSEETSSQTTLDIAILNLQQKVTAADQATIGTFVLQPTTRGSRPEITLDQQLSQIFSTDGSVAQLELQMVSAH